MSGMRGRARGRARAGESEPDPPPPYRARDHPATCAVMQRHQATLARLQQEGKAHPEDLDNLLLLLDVYDTLNPRPDGTQERENWDALDPMAPLGQPVDYVGYIVGYDHRWRSGGYVVRYEDGDLFHFPKNELDAYRNYYALMMAGLAHSRLSMGCGSESCRSGWNCSSLKTLKQLHENLKTQYNCADWAPPPAADAPAPDAPAQGRDDDSARPLSLPPLNLLASLRDARPEGAHAKCCVLQPSTGPERWTTGCGCVIIRTSHGATTAREMIGSSTAARGDRSAARRVVGGVAGPGSAQTKKEVSVHQGSLIRKACRYVRRACMWVVCCSNCTWVWSSTVRTTQSHRAQQFAAVKAIASGLHSAAFP
jgi:hypothetical protein